MKHVKQYEQFMAEEVSNGVVTCDDCGWDWKLTDGGTDPFICHKCGRDNAVTESKESDQLAKEIDKAIIKINDSMSYEDFALAVSKILKDEYGTHNFGPFMEVLHKDLGI